MSVTIVLMFTVNHIEPYHEERRNLHNMSFDTARSERDRNERNKDPVMNRLAEGRTPLQSPLPKNESPKFTRPINRQNGNLIWTCLPKSFVPMQSFCRNDIFLTFPRTDFSHFISPKPTQKPGEMN